MLFLNNKRRPSWYQINDYELIVTGFLVYKLKIKRAYLLALTFIKIYIIIFRFSLLAGSVNQFYRGLLQLLNNQF